eukprot:PITA_19266
MTPYKHPKAYRDEIERAIQELLALGHIRPGCSPFTSSIVPVKKKDGTLWICIDYKDLNKKTLKNWYPIAHIDELMDELRGTMYFSRIDLCSGYHQIQVRDQYIPKIVFRTWKEHLQTLEEVLHILEGQQFYAKLSKFEFVLTEMLYLGHIIREDGVQVHEEKIRAIRDWPVPQNVTELMRIVGI